jgi:acetyl esterase/lipase
MTAVATAVLLASCASTSDDDVPASGTSVRDVEVLAGLVVARDVAVADVTVADVFAPAAEQIGLPVVVMFHGTEGLRANMEPLAIDVARSGAVVVVPSWPVITQRPLISTTEDVYAEQAAAAVCAVRFARTTATEFGGDATDLTVLGHSGGGPVGARVALVDEPPWPGIDCYPGTSSHVDRFIGTAGDFTGDYQFSSWIPELYHPYDVFDLQVTNPDLEVRLFHGGADTNVWVGVSTDFDQHLRSLGIDSDVAYVETAHGDLIQPSTPAGRLVADQVDALVHDRSSVFDPGGTTAVMRFEDDRCSYDPSGPDVIGQPLHLRLLGDRDVPVWFSLVGFEPGLTDADVAAILADAPRRLDDPPRAPIDANFVQVLPGSEGEMTWVIVTDALRWVAYCMPEAGSGHPGAGKMYPAAEVALTR